MRIALFSLAALIVLPMCIACSSSQTDDSGAVVLFERDETPTVDEDLPDVDDDPETPRNEASVANRTRLRDTDFADDDEDTPMREDAALRE